jgi:hypothetical protein
LNFTLLKGNIMRFALLATPLILSATMSWAQPARPASTYFEGFNLSMGLAQNSTESSYGTTATKLDTRVGVGKLNYTFGLSHPAKLGVTATLDLRSSQISNTEYLAVRGLSEVTVEPGVLLVSNSLLYGKVGTYASRYESGTNPTRSLSGSSVGLGLKHYVYRNNYVQAEWTRRKAADNGAGLADTQFKQTSAAVLVGYNF